MVGDTSYPLIAGGRYRDDAGSPRANLLEVRDHLVIDMSCGGDAHHGRLLVEERDGPVLHLAGGIGLGRDVADLLELERAFQAHGKTDVTSQI